MVMKLLVYKGSVHSVGTLDKRIFTSWVGLSGMALDFNMLLRVACNLKLMNCLFWNFLFNIFRPQLTTG
jgi:hypothetical protein